MMRNVGLATVVAGVVALSGCGAANENPVTPPTPTPASSKPGGTVRGRYVFRLEPAASCHAPGTSFSFAVNATAQDGVKGVRLLQENAATNTDDPILEMEFLYAEPTLAGSIATMPWIDSGIRSSEGTYVWIQGVANGQVATGAAGVGEVAQGTLIADLSFGRNSVDRDGLGDCTAARHQWSLKVQ
jgi:hypothetical protein